MDKCLNNSGANNPKRLKYFYSPNFLCYFIVKNFKGDDET